MLSDHSTDEDEVQQQQRCRQREDRIYFTIPDPKNSKAHLVSILVCYSPRVVDLDAEYRIYNHILIKFLASE